MYCPSIVFCRIIYLLLCGICESTLEHRGEGGPNRYHIWWWWGDVGDLELVNYTPCSHVVWKMFQENVFLAGALRCSHGMLVDDGVLLHAVVHRGTSQGLGETLCVCVCDVHLCVLYTLRRNSPPLPQAFKRTPSSTTEWTCVWTGNKPFVGLGGRPPAYTGYTHPLHVVLPLLVCWGVCEGKTRLASIPTYAHVWRMYMCMYTSIMCISVN